MRSVILGIAAASALALGSAANAAVTVTSSTNLNDPNPMAPGSVDTVGGVTTIVFGQNPVATPNFSGSFIFNNTEAGLYSFVLNSSTPGLAFTGASVGSFNLTPLNPRNWTLDGASLLANTNYTFSFTGTSQLAGALSGNVTITPVPEPATWAMMLMGFGAMGLSIRRRRRPALAQVA